MSLGGGLEARRTTMGWLRLPCTANALYGGLNADVRLSDLLYDSLFKAVMIRLGGSLVAVGFS